MKTDRSRSLCLVLALSLLLSLGWPSEAGVPLAQAEIAVEGGMIQAVLSSQATQTESPVYGVVTNGGTNFREGPSTHSYSMMKLDRGTEVEILSIPDVVSSETFYQVRYDNQVGYIMSTFIRLKDGEGTPTSPPLTSGSNQPSPTTPPPTDGQAKGQGQPTPTVPPPTDGQEQGQPTPTATASTGAYTHVRLILSSCHLREAPDGHYDSSNDWIGRGNVLPLAGQPVVQGPYTWYPVLKNGKVYYVRNDCVQPFAEGATTQPTTSGSGADPTPAPTDAPTTTVTNALGYVKTTKGGCNLRSSIGGTVIKQLAKNLVLPYLLPPVTKDGYTWYYVDADGNRGYLRGDVVKVVNMPTATPTPTSSGSPDVNPTSDPATGYVKTTASGINLRKEAGYTEVIGKVDRDVLMPYYGEPTTVKGAVWYYVRHPSLGYGYLSGSYLIKVDANGNAVPTPTPVVVTGSGSSSGRSQQEAEYTTLKLGSTGTAVKNLVQELKNQGYYTGTVVSRYTSSVERAVRALQTAKGLAVDGIAGAATQHALYGTVPVGTGDLTNLTMTIYPAEKIDWYTGGINELWPKGSNYKVYDVKTGIVWWAHRWSGGKHIDAEPLTAADTARLCKCYGVSDAQEIADKNMYQRRPLLVTIGTRTFACSLYGVPHNYPEGDTIADNEFKGQLCIHFTNSKTHSGNKVDSDHEAAIEYAWENAPNGHK